MQNTVQYNGYFGCGWCLHPGKCIEGKQTDLCTKISDRLHPGYQLHNHYFVTEIWFVHYYYILLNFIFTHSFLKVFLSH